MSKLNSPLNIRARKIINSTWFNMMILALIIINGILIGYQTFPHAPKWTQIVQLCILIVFGIEVWLRWQGRTSTKEYFGDWWNWFDIVILLTGVVPEIYELLLANTNEDQKSIMATLRVLRIVQLTRSIRAIDELRVLIGVLFKSIRSLSYIAVLFLLIMYIYAIIGVTFLKNDKYNQSEHLELTVSNPDPYGDIWEAFFTLFRILTGEDWTDLRYNLLNNEHTTEAGDTVPTRASNFWITLYHPSKQISWGQK